jgi:hypothetical protein
LTSSWSPQWENVSLQLQNNRRLALELLANSPGGCTLTLLQSRGFPLSVVYGLVRDGLAITRVESIPGTDLSPVDVIRISITEIGRGALEKCSAS